MPDIDVTDVLDDPMYCQPLTIQRRQEAVIAKGRATTNVVVSDPAPSGVVKPVSDQPLQRGPDQQNLPRLLEVHTPFRLRSASRQGTGEQYQPDRIVWNGDTYVVNKAQDYSPYRPAWSQADPPPPLPPQSPPPS